MSLYFDTSDPGLKAKLEALVPTPGYCVFIDISGSTQMKDQELFHWATLIHNAFANVRTFMPTSAFPLKCLGDALMYFIPKTQPAQASDVPLQLFAGLASIVDDRDPIFPQQKAAVVSGRAYELTFIQGQDDVYGKDIDLAARLLSRARSREVLLNRAFYDEVRAAYKRTRSTERFQQVERIRHLGPLDVRGFATRVEAFVYGPGRRGQPA